MSWNNDEYIWILNIIIEGTQKFEFDIDGKTPFVLSDIDFKTELDLYLANPYVKQMFNKLEEVFGKGSVTPKIGLLQYYQ